MVTGLTRSTTYYFALGVVDEAINYSLISNTVSATTVTGDDVSPSQIADLQATSSTGVSITLSWSAVGDDGMTGTATGYDIRYSTSQITTNTHYNAATQVTGEPQPAAPGTQETFTVTGLQQNTTYYFAIKAFDEVNNYSPLSNVISYATLQVSLVTATDDFNRANLGTNWLANPEFQIQNNELANTATIYDWGYLAAYLPVTNPVAVSFKWGGTATASGIEEGGFAFLTDSTGAGLGYFLWLRPSNRTINLFALQERLPHHRIGTALNMAGGAATPIAGSVVKVEISTDGNGHHFTCYVNDVLAGTISDANKEVGDAAARFAGFNLRGNLDNNVDDFTVYYYTVTDVMPPARVTDLAASSPTATTVTLTWTAVGDDGMTGVASYYDIRYATFALNQSNFTQGTKCEGEPAPSAPGTQETYVVTGLQGNTTYYFALGVVDEEVNYSPISNTASATTIIGDQIPPSQITSLQAGSPTGSSVTLTWNAVGDDGIDGIATGYDVRYSTSQITTNEHFNAATQASGEPQPAAAGTQETFVVTGLLENTTYYFAVKAFDEDNNYSPLSNVVSAKTLQVALMSETDNFNRANLGTNWFAPA
ncbi:MAG: fibronectin type III domain-containing protein, partial [Cyanobacteriota bacterium]